MEILVDPPTVKGPAQWFTGDVWFDLVAAPPAPSRLRVNEVRFAPESRTFWHEHANGRSRTSSTGAR